MLNMEDILFPHEKIRESQNLLISDVLETLKNKRNLLAHAPTGIGKTSILGPVLSFSLKNNLDVFFLTSRHTQHKIAVETLKKIREKYNKKINVLDIIGKKWLCIQSGIEVLKGQQFSDQSVPALWIPELGLGYEPDKVISVDEVRHQDRLFNEL